jgi:hypothetical protein
MKPLQNPPPVFRPAFGLAQMKPAHNSASIAASLHSRIHPSAPPVYRPQAAGVQPKSIGAARVGTAPPVYRPVPAGVQQKSVVRNAPPVYRPQAAGLQSKTVAIARVGTAPPVYRPVPAGIQQKSVVRTAPPVYRPQVAGVQSKSAPASQYPGVKPRGPRVVQRMQGSPYWGSPSYSSWPQTTDFNPTPWNFFQPPVVSYYVPPPTPTHTFSQPLLSWDTHPVEPLFGGLADISDDMEPEMDYISSIPYDVDGLLPSYESLMDEETRKWLEEYDLAPSAVPPQNPYKWAVKSKQSYVVNEPSVKEILESFGDPTTEVIRTYDDLATRVGYDVGHGGLTSTTIADLQKYFDASHPLHFQFNTYLNHTWTTNLNNYSGGKKEIKLYSAMRSDLTKGMKEKAFSNTSLNDVLKAVSGRPAEVHHLLYKAKRPGLANNVGNLVLSQRSESESRSGPGQHELMHMVSSGKDKNKFNVLLDEFETQYKSYMKPKSVLL